VRFRATIDTGLGRVGTALLNSLKHHENNFPWRLGDWDLGSQNPNPEIIGVDAMGLRAPAGFSSRKLNIFLYLPVNFPAISHMSVLNV